MIIGIDASKAAASPRTGIENLVYQLILHLQKVDSENKYLLFTNQSLDRELVKQENFIEKQSGFIRGWSKISLPLLTLQNKTDIYIQPADSIPPTATGRKIVIVHDLAWQYFPEAYSKDEISRQSSTLKNYRKFADDIICVSQSTKHDLVSLYPELEPKISVIQLGCDSNFFHPFENPRDLLKVNSPYILSIGRLEGRKNTERLIKAFIKLKTEKQFPHKLVLAGTPGFNWSQISTKIEGLKSADIIFPGYIDHDQLPEIIARADIFAFPSLYEGFGLPILESFACGTPVVTSNTSSIPEVAGDAALLCDPLDEADLADKIWQFVSDPKLRAKHSKLGLEQAKKFSWEITAQQFYSIIEELK